MNLKVKLILFIAFNIHFNNVNGQDTLGACNDSVPESYSKMVFSQNEKEIDSKTLYSYQNLTDTLLDYNSIYCEYILKYVNCEGFMENDSKVSIGGNFCEFLTDKSTLLRLRGSSYRATLKILQYGDKYIVYKLALNTGMNNSIWFYFERKSID
ncbi:MAG: hypothetical protein GQ574_23780 [Crocinitomix sp.]|nr:hypothetical protein [Crocinitomix sp.]